MRAHGINYLLVFENVDMNKILSTIYTFLKFGFELLMN